MFPSMSGFGASGLTVTTSGHNVATGATASAIEITNNGAADVLILPNAILVTDMVSQTPLGTLGTKTLPTDPQIRRVVVADLDTFGYLLKSTKTVTFRGYATSHGGPQIVCFAAKSVSGNNRLDGGVVDCSSQ